MQSPIFSLSSQQPARQLYDYLHNRVKIGNARKEGHMPTDSGNAHKHTHNYAHARTTFVLRQLEPRRGREPRAQGHGPTFATSTFGVTSTFGGFGGSPHILRNTPFGFKWRTALRPNLPACIICSVSSLDRFHFSVQSVP